MTQERIPYEIYEHNYIIHKSHQIVLLHVLLVVAGGSENTTPVLADGQEPRNGDSCDEVLLSLAHPVTADVMEHPNKEHSDEVHPPTTHSVASDVHGFPVMTMLRKCTYCTCLPQLLMCRSLTHLMK